ncbi:hypothetical protein [Caenimonas sp. SL110]|uniref:hypothetical protein n=1 Tax=Caenimonas sp. SL110 TaxID=1450524 RepID=UPI00065378AA|nr:hypothetical protein [Caenimonas sp. SL110]
MDASEKIAHDYFVHRGFKSIVYEPDGNIPPDLLLDSSTAVEVRRLNQNYFDAAGAQGLEQVAIPLWRKVKALFTSMGPPISGESWFVHFRYGRPVEPWKSLEPKLRAGLTSFMASPTKGRTVVATGQGFELEVFCRTSNPHASMFVMAGCSDEESGGWVLAEMETNIRYCASEKARKIAKVRPNYSTWWLALVDHIGYALDDFDQEMFREQVSIQHSWDKIILIDPRDHTRAFEI